MLCMKLVFSLACRSECCGVISLCCDGANTIESYLPFLLMGQSLRVVSFCCCGANTSHMQGKMYKYNCIQLYYPACCTFDKGGCLNTYVNACIIWVLVKSVGRWCLCLCFSIVLQGFWNPLCPCWATVDVLWWPTISSERGLVFSNLNCGYILTIWNCLILFFRNKRFIHFSRNVFFCQFISIVLLSTFIFDKDSVLITGQVCYPMS